MAKNRTEVADIDRSMYDFRYGEEGFRLIHILIQPIFHCLRPQCHQTVRVAAYDSSGTKQTGVRRCFPVYSCIGGVGFFLNGSLYCFISRRNGQMQPHGIIVQLLLHAQRP